MQNSTEHSARFVVCINNTGYPASLEIHKIYCVVPDADATASADIRVMDESGEDYLYPASYFAPIAVPVSVRKSIQKAAQSAALTNR
jgi:hypothetical protein